MLRYLLQAAACLLAAFAIEAQAQAPTVTTIPARPSETQDINVVVKGEFPRGDYELAAVELKSVSPIMTLLPSGANEYRVVVWMRYRWNADGVGPTVMKPYDGQVSIGRFPRFARIHLVVEYVPVDGVARSTYWDRLAGGYQTFLYVYDPEPPRVTVDTKSPSTTDPVKLTLRFYHASPYTLATSHTIEGNVIRVRQSVTIDPLSDRFYISEAVVPYDLGTVPEGTYTIEYLQSIGGEPFKLMGTAALTVKAIAQACSKNHYILIRMEKCQVGASGSLTAQPISLDFGSVVLGRSAGPVSFDLERSVAGELEIRGIGVNNLDYAVTHNCPIAPQRLPVGATCRVSVRFTATLIGLSPGKLTLRYFNTDTGAEESLLIPLSGTTVLEAFVNFSPAPITPSGTAVEYYLASRDQYFISTDSQEKLSLDSGDAGPWTRTGITFGVGGADPVCRFYGDALAGPRSHFYTASAAECEALKTLDRTTPLGQRAFRYEGVAFRAESSGAAANTARPYCASTSSRRPIYRLYNDGPARGLDPNHRHVASNGTAPGGKSGEDIVREMLERGWIYEGHALCN